MTVKRIGVLTSGGDAPGLNAAIKGVVSVSCENGIEVTGILDGWKGLLDGYCDETLRLDQAVTEAWDRDGGTNIGSSRTNPFGGKDKPDKSEELLRNMRKLGLDALVAMGGEDTMGVAARLSAKGVRVVGVPKTIDKDLYGTDYTIGFDTALRNCLEIIDKSRTPASSHHWVQVIEVMGRNAGHLAFWSGVASGADIILVPECPFEFDRLLKLVENRMRTSGKDRPRYAVIVTAEGASPKGGGLTTVDGEKDVFGHEKLGGIGAVIAAWVKSKSKWDARSAALGHPQRGGQPTAIDRAMGFSLGSAAAKCAVSGRFGVMVSARGSVPEPALSTVPLGEVGGKALCLDVAKYYDEQKYNMKTQTAL